MAHVAYYRVSTTDQSIDAQQHAMQQAGIAFDKEFKDEGVSGAVLARERPGFAALLNYVREGDTVHVYAVDRLGRDALDVQATVRGLIQRKVTVEVIGLGPIGPGVGELILAVLAQVADMERNRIAERCAAGRDKARAAGKSLGRPFSMPTERRAAIRAALRGPGATVYGVAKQYGTSRRTVMRIRDGSV